MSLQGLHIDNQYKTIRCGVHYSKTVVIVTNNVVVVNIRCMYTIDVRRITDKMTSHYR